MLVSVTIYTASMFTMPGILGNHGLWDSVMLFMIARALTLLVLYPRIERVLAES